MIELRCEIVQIERVLILQPGQQFTLVLLVYEVTPVDAGLHDVAANDFRALLHIMVAETAGSPLTAGELRRRMGMSGAAITYLVERMIDSGHIRRDSDPADRRKQRDLLDQHLKRRFAGRFTARK